MKSPDVASVSCLLLLGGSANGRDGDDDFIASSLKPKKVSGDMGRDG